MLLFLFLAAIFLYFATSMGLWKAIFCFFVWAVGAIIGYLFAIVVALGAAWLLFVEFLPWLFPAFCF